MTSTTTTFPGPAELIPTLRGTLFFLCCYTFLFMFQSFSKLYLYLKLKREKKTDDRFSFQSLKYYNTEHPLCLAGDRGFGNCLEQALCFLPTYWLYSLFITTDYAFEIACIYGTTRLIYPFLWLWKGKFGSPVFLSTVPGYIVLMYMFWPLIQLTFLAARRKKLITDTFGESFYETNFKNLWS